MKNYLTILLVVLCFPLMAQQGFCERGNCQEGKGRYVYPDGASYDGHFVHGRYQGIGIMRYANGSMYVGNWHAGIQHGKGKLTEQNGTVYFGYFSNGRRQGQGCITYPDGNQIFGNWLNDQISGAGEFRFANGDFYRGQIVDARLQGQGSMTYNNGDTYTGLWNNSTRTGFGTMTFENGLQLQGNWSDNEFLTDWNRLGFRGDPKTLPNCNSGCDSPRGQLTYADGRTYRGEFLNGRPAGGGTVTYPNGNVFKGSYLQGRPEGLGVMHFADGTIQGGIWQDGRLYRRLYTATGEPSPNIQPTYDDETKVWAVVVGAARYNHMRTLKYTDDDAYHLYAFLKSVEGGALPDRQVKILIDDDATHDNIMTAVHDVFQRADENDVVLFYFSGHGLRGAFLPVDYDGEQNRLEHYELRDALAASRAKHKLVIADACHSGSLGGRPEGIVAKTTGAAEALSAYYEGLANAQSSTALLLSSKGEEISLEDGGLRSGIFSHFLIRGLKGEADQDADRLVSISELFGFVHREVRSYTGNIQTPTLTGTFDDNMPISVIRAR